MPRCATCGEDNQPDADRCRVCGAPLEEDRLISVLVVDLVDATDPAAEHGRSPADADAGAAAARHEIRLLGGAFPDPGDHLAVGVFGAPVPRADAAERAVRAALRVHDAVKDLGRPGVALRSGVHTGAYPLPPMPSSAGLDSPEIEVPDRAMDAGAALAASKQGAGAGVVVVDDATHDATHGLFEYERAGDPEVWVAFAPRGSYGVDFELNIPTPFIGRDHELALLTDVYAGVLLETSPHVVTIVGPAGAGKSRLLSEFWNVLDARPELVYWRQGRSLGGDPGVTLWALSEVVKGQAGILESDDLQAAEGKLDATLRTFLPDEEEAGRVGALLGPLAGLVPEDPRPVPHAESFPAWLRFLEAVASKHPMVLVFEDLHLADPGTTAFVQYLSEQAAGVPMLVVCTARLEVLDHDRPWHVGGAGTPRATTITLGPLSEHDTRELVASLGGPADPSGNPPVELLEAAGGNPLYVESYVRLASEGTGTAGRRPPATLAALMAERLDALGLGLRSLVEDAAVVGKVFWPGALEAIGGRGPREVAEGLRELADRQLVRPARRTSVAGEAEHAFWHIAVRDAASLHTDAARRADAHRAAVAWAVGMAGDRVADHAEILALHAGRADPRSADTRRYLLLAAGRAELLDPARAADLYRRAAALEAGGSPERQELERRAAEAAGAAEA